jgi:hypothetical protein
MTFIGHGCCPCRVSLPACWCGRLVTLDIRHPLWPLCILNRWFGIFQRSFHDDVRWCGIVCTFCYCWYVCAGVDALVVQALLAEAVSPGRHDVRDVASCFPSDLLRCPHRSPRLDGELCILGVGICRDK